MTAPDSDRFRKAALALHGLSGRDQAWLLRRLLPATRASLQSLLRQLRALGIAPGMVSDETTLPAAAENTALNPGDVGLIDAASVSRAAAVLARQPEQLQAVLLCLHAWRWRAAYWDSLPAFQRSRMVELLAGAPRLRAAMLDALLHAFADALGAQR
jgi:hypothetical protein